MSQVARVPQHHQDTDPQHGSGQRPQAGSPALAPIRPVHCSTTAFVGPLPSGPRHTAVAIDSAAKLAATFAELNKTSPVLEAARLFFENGGTNAIIVRTDSTELDQICGNENHRTGVWALLQHDVNLICVPDTRTMTLEQADTVFGAALEVAHQSDALYLIDPPEDLGRQPLDLDEWLPVDAQAAVYLPYLQRRDRHAGPDDQLALSGAVAGVIARTEANAGVWLSPSGTDSHIESENWQLAYEPGNRTRVQMRRLGINIVCDMDKPILWGSRTLMARGAITPDEMYISVSRTASMLRRSIQKGIEWAMVEPNDELLWETITAAVEEFLGDLWRRGAFAGDGAGNSYFVQCDESTMRVAPGGIPKILVGFAPVEGGQFVPLEVAFPTPRWLI